MSHARDFIFDAQMTTACLIPRLHDHTTGCQDGCTTDLTTGCIV